jgi:NhaP-type Na+/H+ or K+/H+ antiporter
VAATAILSRLNIPRRMVTILEGESLVNDASGLVIYKLAIAAVLTGAFSLRPRPPAVRRRLGGGIADRHRHGLRLHRQSTSASATPSSRC